MKTAELTGGLLDYWVAKAEGLEFETHRGDLYVYVPIENQMRPMESYSPSSAWRQGGPIIEREKISTSWDDQKGHERGYWFANYEFPSDTLLIAAMRCYVASKFGNEVPDADMAAGSGPEE